MDRPNNELHTACNQLKSLMSLTDGQLEFMAEMCYINKGMWFNDTNALIRGEAKRELALFLKSIRECTTEELAWHFLNNGEEEWIIKTMTQLTPKR